MIKTWKSGQKKKKRTQINKSKNCCIKTGNQFLSMVEKSVMIVEIQLVIDQNGG